MIVLQNWLTPNTTPFIIKEEMTIMFKWDKLLYQIRNLSGDLRFDELRKVLEEYGYTMKAPKDGSSHYTFRKDGVHSITIPKHNTIKKVYVEMVRDIVEGEEKKNEND